MRRRDLNLHTLAVLSIVIATVSTQNCVAASDRPLCVRPLNTPFITIDPRTGSGKGTLWVRNQTSKPAELALIGPKSSVASPISIEFATQTSPRPTVVYEAILAPRETTSVDVLVSNDWSDGESD